MKRYLNRLFVLKVLSIIAICLVHIPSQKFPIPYGIIVFATLIERLSELDLSLDLLMSICFIVSVFMILKNNKWFLLTGYLLMISSLIFYLTGGRIYSEFNPLFWVPLLIFGVLLITVVFKEFKRLRNRT